MLGMTVNHSTFVCTRVNEPLMTSVAGGWPAGLVSGVGGFGAWRCRGEEAVAVCLDMLEGNTHQPGAGDKAVPLPLLPGAAPCPCPHPWPLHSLPLLRAILRLWGAN